MRVTSRSLVDNVVRNLQSQSQSLDRLQNQISSNRRMLRPSDDPASAWRSLRSRQEHAGNLQLGRNIDEARNWLGSTDRALQSANDVFAQMRELSVQGADDSYSANDRAALADQLKQLKEHLVGQFNGTTYLGQTLFSGRRTDLQPFSTDAAGNVSYNGETGLTVPAGSSDLTAANGIQALTMTDITSAVPGDYQVSVTAPLPGGTTSDVTITRYDSLGVAIPGATETITVTVPAAGEQQVLDFSNLGLTVTVNDKLGTFAFAESATSQFTAGNAQVAREVSNGTTQAVNMLGSKYLTTLQDITALEKALRADDQIEISKGISNLDKAIELTLVTQAEIGTRINRLDAALERATAADDEVLRMQADVENLDLAEALTRLTTQQTIYRAALQTGASSMSLSLLDFLK